MKTLYSILCDLDPSMESTTCTKETGSLSHVWTIFTETQPENLGTHAGSQCRLQYQTKEEGLILSCVVNFFFSSSCCIRSLQYYDAMDKEAQAISLLFEYTDSDDTAGDTPSHAVAQLPIEAMVGLPMEAVPLRDLATTITK